MLEAGYDVSARPGWDPLVDSQTPNLEQVVEGEITKIANTAAGAGTGDDIPLTNIQAL